MEKAKKKKAKKTSARRVGMNGETKKMESIEAKEQKREQSVFDFVKNFKEYCKRTACNQCKILTMGVCFLRTLDEKEVEIICEITRKKQAETVEK